MPFKDPAAKSTYKREYYLKNKGKIAAKNRAYRAANPEKIREQQSANYRANREKRAAYSRVYNEANREKLRPKHTCLLYTSPSPRD